MEDIKVKCLSNGKKKLTDDENLVLLEEIKKQVKCIVEEIKDMNNYLCKTIHDTVSVMEEMEDDTNDE